MAKRRSSREHLYRCACHLCSVSWFICSKYRAVQNSYLFFWYKIYYAFIIKSVQKHFSFPHIIPAGKKVACYVKDIKKKQVQPRFSWTSGESKKYTCNEVIKNQTQGRQKQNATNKQSRMQQPVAMEQQKPDSDKNSRSSNSTVLQI